MSEFVQRFKQDSDFPDWYQWTTGKPVFAAARVQYSMYVGSVYRVDDSEADESIDVLAVCDQSDRPGPLHESAWEYLLRNAAETEAAVRRKLMSVHLRGYRELLNALADPLIPREALGDDEWEEIKQEVPWESLKAVDSLFALDGITLFDQGADGTGFVAYEFQCGWDEEHGVSVITHQDRVLSSGGMSEYVNRKDGLIDTIRYEQDHWFEDGDTRIDEIIT